MPVTSCHPQYSENIELWRKCRTIIQGEEAVKAAGDRYLPRLDGQDQTEYEAYKMRALFYGAADRTVKGLRGAILAKAATVKMPEQLVELSKRLGASGESLEGITQTVLGEVIGIGRVGLLVDAAEDVENGEPFVEVYFAEQITSWRTEMVGGRRTLVRLVLREELEQLDPTDPFAFKSETRYRVLKLGDPETGLEVGPEDDRESARYFVEIWRREDTLDQKTKQQHEHWILEDTIEPRIRGGLPLREIPFTVVNPSSLGFDVEKSPILDLVNVNLSHYRSSADLEHGRHFTALPTAVAAGFGEASSKLKIGSGVAWQTNDTSAHAEFLEFTGAGLGHLAEALKEKQQLMAILGARLLEDQKRAAEAAETLQLRQAGEKSILADIAANCSEGLTRVLRLAAMWLGSAEAESASVELNKDFNLVGIDAATLQALMLAVQAGQVSWQTFFYNVKRGELIPDNVTAEEEAELIAAGGPQGGLPRPPASGEGSVLGVGAA